MPVHGPAKSVGLVVLPQRVRPQHAASRRVAHSPVSPHQIICTIVSSAVSPPSVPHGKDAKVKHRWGMEERGRREEAVVSYIVCVAWTWCALAMPCEQHAVATVAALPCLPHERNRIAMSRSAEMRRRVLSGGGRRSVSGSESRSKANGRCPKGFTVACESRPAVG